VSLRIALVIVWARFATGKVFHAVDHRWPYQRNYFTLCGQFKKGWEMGGREVKRKCKTCKRIWSYHLRRSRGLNLTLPEAWFNAEWRHQ